MGFFSSGFFSSSTQSFITTHRTETIKEQRDSTPTENISALSQSEQLNHLANELKERSLLTPLDILLVGGTGTGKSSTLNALFGKNVATVGTGVDPETQSISAYQLHENFRIHDSAGLGDGKAADFQHAKNITDELMRVIRINGHSYKFMDLAMVILDGGSRDLGTAFKLLESVVLKSIEPDRVIVAINQADMAMKGRGWNHVNDTPEQELKNFLEEKAISVQKRIKDSTGLTIKKPIYYSALHKYNMGEFMEHIILHLPKNRRTV